MLKIQSNSRQVPKKEKIVSNKDYCDLVYSWFQCESKLTGNERLVSKDKVKYSHIAIQLGMDRRTVAKYVKKLIDLELITITENGDYKLHQLEANAATLVPFLTLRQLINSLHKNSVSIFVYLLNRYLGNGEKGFYVTHYSLKKFIGIATSTTSNNVIISDILKTLKLLGLIDYEICQTGTCKLNIFIRKVNNVIK